MSFLNKLRQMFSGSGPTLPWTLPCLGEHITSLKFPVTVEFYGQGETFGGYEHPGTGQWDPEFLIKSVDVSSPEELKKLVAAENLYDTGIPTGSMGSRRYFRIKGSDLGNLFG